MPTIAMSEDQLYEHVRELCQYLGVLVYHTHDSRRSHPGFPDLVLVGSAVLYRELKRDDAQPTMQQRHWIGALRAAGADAAVWRPGHWRSGEIRAELQAIRSHPRFECPRCHAISYHPEDIRNGYCAACKDFTGKPRGGAA